MLQYISGGGYHYKQQKDGRIHRVSHVDESKHIPKVGDKIKIIIKPYHKKKYITGNVKRVLTKKKFHSRGHKVMLENGVVGRTISIL